MIFLKYEEKNIIFKLKKLMVENLILTVFFRIFNLKK